MLRLIQALCALAAASSVSAGPLDAGAGLYRQVAAIPLGAPERWDYVVADAPSGRVYVAHGDRLTVVDGRTLKLVGEVTGITGVTHGTYISQAPGLGFTDDGEAAKAIVFDPRTLAVRATLDAAQDADAVTGDARGVYVIDGDSGVVTVIDPSGAKVIATIKVGGSLEAGAVDGRGDLFVNGAERGEVVRIDTRTDTVAARWPVPDCTRPHGAAIDPDRQRLFVSCVNGRLDVLDTASGREVASVPIGLGTDSAAFDPVRHRVFSANGRDGTISVIQQFDADTYRPLTPVRTQVSARTMAMDTATGRLFVAAADVDPSGPATGRRRFLPGSLKLLAFDPLP